MSIEELPSLDADDPVGGCEHVEFQDGNAERCGADADRVEVGGVTVRLCDDHAAQARRERGAA